MSGRAVVSVLKSAENRKRVAFPFAAASAAHFPSVAAETHAGERRPAVIGPRVCVEARAKQSCHGDGLEPAKVVS